MERELWTIEALQSLGYESDLCRARCGCDELPCPLISWLVLELRQSCPEIGGKSGTVLAGDLKEMLKAMFCPFDTLVSETLTPGHLRRVTEFLVSELLAARLLKYREGHPDDTEMPNSVKEQRRREPDTPVADETTPTGGERNCRDVTEELTELFRALAVDQAGQLGDAYSQLEARLALLPEGEGREPLLKSSLSSSQWSQLEQINQALKKDYENRRQMMVTRFHVTFQSFSWGERGKERASLMSATPPGLGPLESSVSVAHLLAAREDQSRILPVTAGPSTAIHKVLMGGVPDRGGRPGEIEPPMPVFTRRSEGGGSGQPRDRGKKKWEHTGKKKKSKKKDP